VAAADFTFVAQRDNGRLLGWGRSASLETGTGVSIDVLTPQATIQGPVESVAMGGRHGCAVRLGGGLQCWGRGGSGQLGAGDSSDRAAFTVPTVTDAAQVCASPVHSCYRSRGGEVYCWGDGANGALGTGSTSTLRSVPASPIAGLSGVTDILCGFRFTCALQPRAGGGREVLCWGSPTSGRLGETLATDRLAPSTPVPGLPTDVVAFARGAGKESTVCVRTTGGESWCWGSNGGFQRGGGGFVGVLPNRVVLAGGMPLTGIAELSMGRTHSCALVITGTPGRFTPYCWGNNGQGQLGLGTTGLSVLAEPMLVSLGGPPIADATAIALSQTATCVLRATGTGGREELWCMGARTSGQLGDASTTGIVQSPQRISGL
ncbi:MAG: hypothetical protein AAF447_15350, partial [Myxococcota bacterium]